MSKLVCSKCEGTLFTETGTVTQWTIMNSPVFVEYQCTTCGHRTTVSYPVQRQNRTPQEVELPKKK